MTIKRFLVFGAAAVLGISGFVLLNPEAAEPLKTTVSNYLIESAWQETLKTERNVQPWPWVDSHPVARLFVPKLDQEQIILSASEASVAPFAPVWHDGSYLPGDNGISLISGYKDTHFSYLKDLGVGDELMLETRNGTFKKYKVEEARIVQENEIRIPDGDRSSILVLSTTYPLRDSAYHNRLHYVVIAREQSRTLAYL